MSGGGGWGLKKGLLSLDPETTLDQIDARYDFDSSNPDNQQIRALENVAKPDSWIQFYISTDLTTDKAVGNLHLEPPGEGFIKLNSLAFGCTSSTVDDIPAPVSDLVGPDNEAASRASIEGYAGHFSAQSEAGIFIRPIGNDKTKSSKVDVPFSTLWGVVIDDD